MEPYKVVYRLPEETRTWYSRNSDQAGQIFTEFKVIFIAELRNVHQNIVSSLRISVIQAYIVKTFQEDITLVCI